MAIWFLEKVAKKYSIPFEELRDSVLCKFTCEQIEDLDSDINSFADTKNFDNYVSQHDFKKVNIDTVFLYLKNAKLAVSNIDLSLNLKDANKKVILIKRVLFTTALALAGFSYLL